MLRLANSDRSYDVIVKIAGEPITLELRSFTLLERMEFIKDIVSRTLTHDGIEELFGDLEKLIISIREYPDKKPAEVFGRLEHRKDLDELCTKIVRWCNLPEQEAKNLDSSPERSDPAPGSTGSVESHVGSEVDPASTGRNGSKPTVPSL